MALAGPPVTLGEWLADPSAPLCVRPDGTLSLTEPHPAGMLPGSFNPLHSGHRRLAAEASRRLGGPVHFELSLRNVDKPDLSIETILARAAQFRDVPLWLTVEPLFAGKAALFPGVAFALGHDTAARLLDARYYAGSPEACDEALARLAALGARVLVGGRVDAAGAFRVWRAEDAGAWGHLFEAIPEVDFRDDVSSTAIRGG